MALLLQLLHATSHQPAEVLVLAHRRWQAHLHAGHAETPGCILPIVGGTLPLGPSTPVAPAAFNQQRLGAPRV